ncbi:MAG: hypothetical protein EXR94_06870 [Gemmatimonadetes bacterium]|nr:hypothetical protein [Gemmatimonadota bacterium]
MTRGHRRSRSFRQRNYFRPAGPGVQNGSHRVKLNAMHPLLPLLLCCLVAACRGDSGPPPPPTASGLGLADVGTFSFPVLVTSPPGDNARIFVVEKTGAIKIVKQGITLATPFLDVRTKISTGGEQGLLGLAFHPGYATNGLFVVNYTDPASEQIVLSVDQPFANHNGGMVAFGPDGQLYIGMGDGGSGGDAQENGQKRAETVHPVRQDGPALGVGSGPSHRAQRQPVRRPARHSAGDLEPRPSQPVAIQLRPIDRRSLHRRCRPERHRRDRRAEPVRQPGRQLRVEYHGG